MRQFLRWCAAIVVTAMTFSSTACLAGVIVLPHLVKDHADRWVIATAFGLAIAALAGAWGYGYVSPAGNQADPAREHSSPDLPARGGSRSVNVTGNMTGIVSTGDNLVNIQNSPENR
jgi:hypothetical protein